jgi:hypothetical protein
MTPGPGPRAVFIMIAGMSEKVRQMIRRILLICSLLFVFKRLQRIISQKVAAHLSYSDFITKHNNLLKVFTFKTKVYV